MSTTTNAMYLIAAFASLTPTLSCAQSSSLQQGNGINYFIAQRAWFATWDLPASDIRVVVADGGNGPSVIDEGITQVPVRGVLSVTTLGARTGPWTISTSISPMTRFTSDQLVSGRLRRAEYDVNVGYSVTPNIGLVAIYKAARSEAGLVRGGVFPDQEALDKQRLSGFLIGLSAQASVGDGLSAYGNLAYGPGRARIESRPSGEVQSISFRYTVSEIGVSYRIPSVAFGNLAVLAGYRFQTLMFSGLELATYDAVTLEELSIRRARIQNITHGISIGLSMAF